ncbi:MAG: bifunctional folylpolyglutamate synthase/dihydrofolate synthase [Tannerellaceae bacterium]|jgi:dihydrofolate synthase/folylpolyglutamate synthase|nr:bifunctional folylpolyglutamate synthase/dihydrofolate synthase [Tannerellaceae bacterium]
MSYQETLQYLYTATPVFEKTGISAYKPGLATMETLSTHCGHPHAAYHTIHVAGTNGKGSVCHLLAAVLSSAGYKVGLYTSPHLVDFRERIQVNGQWIPENYVIDFVDSYKSFFEPLNPSFFEVTTALAFSYFRDAGVEVAVIETGLGGRLDSTNIISPVLSIITAIGRDHTNLLGEDPEAIASEKAGIIKHKVPVVLGYDIRSDRDGVYGILQERAKDCNAAIHSAWDDKQLCRFYTDFSTVTNPAGRTYITAAESCFDSRLYGRIHTSLTGEAGRANAATVLTALGVLTSQGFTFTHQHVAEGFAHVDRLTGLKGRWQQLSSCPLVICDGGHNADAWKHIKEQIVAYDKRGRFGRLHFVLGFSADKDIEAIIPYLPLSYSSAVFYFTQASVSRALEAHTLLDKIKAHGAVNGKAYPTVAEALAEALGVVEQEDFLFIGGSFFVVGEALPLFERFKVNT